MKEPAVTVGGLARANSDVESVVKPIISQIKSIYNKIFLNFSFID